MTITCVDNASNYFNNESVISLSRSAGIQPIMDLLKVEWDARIGDG